MSVKSSSKRRAAFRLGRVAEKAVEDYLVARGFRILARNLRLEDIEIDLLARSERLVVVVEVRTRSPSAWASALQSVTPAKKERIRRAGALVWAKRFERDQSVERMRYDVAAVYFDPEGKVSVEYIEGAF